MSSVFFHSYTKLNRINKTPLTGISLGDITVLKVYFHKKRKIIKMEKSQTSTVKFQVFSRLALSGKQDFPPILQRYMISKKNLNKCCEQFFLNQQLLIQKSQFGAKPTRQ